MKLVITILAFFLLVGCPKDKISTKSTEKASTKKLEKIDACEQTTLAKVASIMGWDISEVKQQQNFSFKDYNFSDCSYRKKETSESVILKSYHKSDKAIENKVLERQFSTFLTKGNQKFTYKEIEGSGTQTILGVYINRGLRFYHLRTRIQNSYEFSSEICTTSTNQEFTEKQLKQLVTLLHQ